MTPTHAIETTQELFARFERLLADMRAEEAELANQWTQLGDIGAQRDDHAAMLLNRLRPHLQELARFAGACELQLAGFAADPFGRNK